METTEEKRATFTPGPWEIEPIESVDNPGKLFELSANDVMIARNWQTFGGWIPGGRAEARANARLIAAAPELLEQCKLFEKVLTHLINSGDSGADLERDKLREVLAKVEGGEG